MMTNLPELADRVEALTGPCRGTDAAIFSAVYPDKVPFPIVQSGYGWRFDRNHWWLATGEDVRIPPRTVSPLRFTASLDAAMTLVPEGWRTWTADMSVKGRTHWMLEGPKTDWKIDPDGEKCAGRDWYATGVAATPALALTAAALCARAADSTSEKGEEK